MRLLKKTTISYKRLVKSVLFSLLLLCVSCSDLNRKVGLSDDNAIEEVVEEVIEAKTGLDIDLTPGSAE